MTAFWNVGRSRLFKGLLHTGKSVSGNFCFDELHECGDSGSRISERISDCCGAGDFKLSGGSEAL